MRVDELILVSVDDHVVEPPDMFTEHLPASYQGRDDVPHVVRTDVGDDVWVYDGREFPNIGLNAVAGRPRDEYGMDPTSYDEMRPGCWDVDARIGDMNANGVLASLCFPSFPRLCGQVFAEAQDKDLAHVLVRAYNDWHVHSWCGRHPGRFIPLGLLPYWDIDLTVAELERLSSLGVHAVSFSENPAKLGLPSLHAEHWDPLWAACQDLGIVVCLHIGSSSTITVTASDAPFDVTATLQAWSANPSSNQGWVVNPGGTDGWRWASSETAVMTDRPVLEVTYVSPGPPPPCYANCDASTTVPILNVADFTCFLQQYASGCP